MDWKICKEVLLLVKVGFIETRESV